jgi:hypothetical protein
MANTPRRALEALISGAAAILAVLLLAALARSCS